MKSEKDKRKKKKSEKAKLNETQLENVSGGYLKARPSFAKGGFINQ